MATQNNISPANRKYLGSNARTALAKRHYADYVQYVHMGRWKRARHLDLVCEKLDSIMEKLAFAARCDNTLNERLVMLDGDGVKLETGEDQAKFLSLYTGFLYGQRLWATKGFKPEDMPASKMVVRNFKLPPYVNPKSEITPGRNEVCPCGSGKKFKKCCGKCID